MVPFGLPHLERGLSGGKPNCPVDGEDSTIPCSGSFVTFQSITWEEQSTFRPPQNPSSTFLPERSWRENSYLFTPADNSSCVHHLLSSANAAVLSSAAVPIRSSFLIIISYRGCGTFFSSERTLEVPKDCTLGCQGHRGHRGCGQYHSFAIDPVKPNVRDVRPLVQRLLMLPSAARQFQLEVVSSWTFP